MRAAAERAEDAYAFWGAARWYRELARRPGATQQEAALARMQSARALQKAENWRTQVAHWEQLGNELGLQIADASEPYHDRYQAACDRDGAVEFGVIADAEWLRRETEFTPDGARRYQQAWAFQWAAEVAESNDENVAAARLYRRAGVSWEKSPRPDRWRRAAICYAGAAICAAKTARHATRRGIHACPWCPSCLRDKTAEEECEHPGPEALTERGEGRGTDMDRLARCWMRAALSPEHKKEDALDAGCRHMTAIQRQLSVSGSRDDAIQVYRKLHEFKRGYFRETGRRRQFVISAFGALTWGNGSSLKHLAGTLFVVYVVLAPLAWMGFDVVKGSPVYPRSILFSLSNMTNSATDHFGDVTWVAAYFQVLQGLSGFVALGVLLWISQRSYA
jgi:hypothetical protein